MGKYMSKEQLEGLQFKTKCPECKKWLSSEEFYYGHDCEDEEEIAVYKMRGN
jgi:hypothetical protein